MASTPPRKQKTEQQIKNNLAAREKEAENKRYNYLFDPSHPRYNPEIAETKVLWENKPNNKPKSKAAAVEPYNWPKAAKMIGEADPAGWAHLWRNPHLHEKPKSPTRKRKRGQAGGRRQRAASTHRRRV